MKRRAFLLCGPALLLACGGAAPVVATPKVRETTLHLSPLTELLQAPGMVWLVDAAPKHLREAGLERAISRIVTGRAFDDFKGRNGGIDLREMDEVMVASYGGVTVSGVRGLLDPGAVERAFTSRASAVDARAIDHAPDVAEDRIVRVFGMLRGVRTQVCTLGRSAALLEEGTLGPVRAAVAFAQGKLKRTKPALHTRPLDRVAELLGDAPLRFFAPGPFEGEWSKAAGGILAAATAFGARAVMVEGTLMFSFVFTGTEATSWDRDAEAVQKRLSAAFDVVSQSDLGKLARADKPKVSATTRIDKDALWLHVGYDPALLAEGIHAALDAEISEILAK